MSFFTLANQLFKSIKKKEKGISTKIMNLQLCQLSTQHYSKVNWPPSLIINWEQNKKFAFTAENPGIRKWTLRSLDGELNFRPEFWVKQNMTASRKPRGSFPFILSNDLGEVEMIIQGETIKALIDTVAHFQFWTLQKLKALSFKVYYLVQMIRISNALLRLLGFPGGASSKEPACQCRRHKRHGFSPWVGKIPWRRTWQPTPVFLPGESHEQKSLMGYKSKGSQRVRHDWSDLACVHKHTHTHIHACIKALKSLPLEFYLGELKERHPFILIQSVPAPLKGRDLLEAYEVHISFNPRTEMFLDTKDYIKCLWFKDYIKCL